MNIISKIQASDNADIAAFITQQWGSHLCVTRGKILDGSKLPGFIYKDEGRNILGLITYHIAGQHCEIITLNSLAQNQGLGTKLLNKVIETARDAGCNRVWLITTNDNTKAIRYYQKRGFHWVAFYKDAILSARALKPEIPLTGDDGIPIRHELEFELPVNA